MKNLVPHLTFAGNCREALEFYKNCIKGEIVSIMTYSEAGMGDDERTKNAILHAEFRAEEINFMAADGSAGLVVNPGNNIQLNINLGDQKEQEAVFSALAEGGIITMPLQDTFWGSHFGMLNDRYGISWMLNCSKQ